MNNRSIGNLGEELVVEHISQMGLVVLARNWRIHSGEIDIVARTSENLIVFIEVKCRRSLTFGDPLEAINKDKAMRLQRLALAWLTLHHLWGSEYRIDCAGVLLSQTGEHRIDYREGVL